jgi:hypothetical protein
MVRAEVQEDPSLLFTFFNHGEDLLAIEPL